MILLIDFLCWGYSWSLADRSTSPAASSASPPVGDRQHTAAHLLTLLSFEPLTEDEPLRRYPPLCTSNHCSKGDYSIRSKMDGTDPVVLAGDADAKSNNTDAHADSAPQQLNKRIEEQHCSTLQTTFTGAGWTDQTLLFTSVMRTQNRTTKILITLVPNKNPLWRSWKQLVQNENSPNQNLWNCVV